MCGPFAVSARAGPAGDSGAIRGPFDNACARHDFGYRNYKAAGQFDANKSRLDSAFYEDMKRVRTGYTGEKNTACNSTAWTYYQAVKIVG